MKFNQLRFVYQAVAAVFGFSMLLTACGNADESANNSTTEQRYEDSVTRANADKTETATPKKKSGRVSAKAESDDASIKIEKDKMGYYTRTDVAPAYNGGDAALENYIVNNLEYPQEAIDNNVEGVVRVQFAVDESGNVTNVSTLGNKLGYGLEEEAVRAVSNMPKWEPGLVKGKKVKTWRTLPINYKLES